MDNLNNVEVNYLVSSLIIEKTKVEDSTKRRPNILGSSWYPSKGCNLDQGNWNSKNHYVEGDIVHFESRRYVCVGSIACENVFSQVKE